MWIRRCAALFALLNVTAPGWAQQDDTQDTATRVVAAFETWLENNKTTGVIALVRDGVVVRTDGFGRDAEEPVELASVSKSITGICAKELVEQGQMDWADTVDARLDVPLNIGLDALLTHQSGLNFDGTQVTMPFWLDGDGGHRGRDVLASVETRGEHGKAGAYQYNNENFALAGLMIEAATGRGYEDVCSELAIEPAGVSATPSPRTGAFLPWGGWQMTASDLALWHGHWFAAEDGLAQDPKSAPFATIDKGLYYGPGTSFRALPRGNTFWHYGALCFPGRLNTGSYASTVFADWTVVAVWDACVDWPAMFAVDQGIWGAVYPRAE